jgi:N-acetylmuramoyl-L-alanine amidase
VVRDAVRDNVAVMEGRPPRPLRRGRRLGEALLRQYRLVGAPGLLFLAIALTSTGGQDAGARAAGLTLEALSTRVAFSAPVSPDAPFPLEVRRIVLDPGHGGVDPGASGSHDLAEKDLTLDIAQRLRALLEESGFDVVMTRERDESVSLRERALLANRVRGDLFVSVHVNAIPGPEPCGMEVYYLGATDDPRARELADLENREAGYALTDLRRLLDGLYAHVRREESRVFAHVVREGLAAFLRYAHPGIKDNGVKTAPFLVLTATEMPGLLAEVSCLSNEPQAQLLTERGHRQSLARGLFVGIRAYAEARTRHAPSGPDKGARS